MSRWLSRSVVPLALAFAPPSVADDDDDVDFEFSAGDVGGAMSAPAAAPTRMSATAGGAQDARYFRDLAARGLVPRPEELPLEGLFSEHDLPLSNPPPCARLLCPAGEAIPAGLVADPDVAWIAQIGFSSRLTSDFARSPLNLVVVVDESGSMSGAPIGLVRETLRTLIPEKLGPKDQVSLVTFSDTARVELEPIPATDRARWIAAVDAIDVDGGTWLDAGLELGLDVAQRTRASFDGQTRVLLLTDEQPNIGRTDVTGFVPRLEAASRDGIGVTTIGVGDVFGQALATRISAVRGSNLTWFPDPVEMRRVLTEDFETLVTPLAYDLDLRVHPAPGTRVVDVYGVPADAWTREPDGSARLSVATMFASKRGGGLLVGLAPDGGGLASGDVAARVELAYDPVDGPAERGDVALALNRPGVSGPGIVRAWRLADIGSGTRAASTRYHQGDVAGAARILDTLDRRLAEVTDPALVEERTTVRDLLTAVGGRPPELLGVR
jgi:Ca-activated chloride channel family protein